MGKTNKILFTVCAGLAIGAVLGVLFAPADGEETRKKLAKRAKKLSGTIEDNVALGKESLEEIKHVLQKELGKVNRKIEEFRQQ